MGVEHRRNVQEQPASREVAFEYIDLVGRFCRLAKRSGDLDGDLPIRAARSCAPVVEGNAAGFHVSLMDTAILHVPRGRVERPALYVADSLSDRLAFQVSSVSSELERLCGGKYWGDYLSPGLFHVREELGILWTGLLVRPRPGFQLLVTHAHNRRCEVDVREYLVTDPRFFVPLVLPWKLDSVRDDRTWLDTEMACVLPVTSDYRIIERRLEEVPELGRRMINFYDPKYMAARSAQKGTGKYLKMLGQEKARAAEGDAECWIVSPTKDLPHSIESIRRVAGRGGFEDLPEDALGLDYASFRVPGEVEIETIGQGIRDIESDIESQSARVRRGWTDLYGHDAALDWLDWALQYAEPVSSPYVERMAAVMPQALFRTPPGWSTVVEACHGARFDGMRGVIGTDFFHMLTSILQTLEGKVTLPAGFPLLRAIPVPRWVLAAPVARRDASVEIG